VFGRFYRAGDVRKLPGSGLGLAIVRQAQNAPGGGALLRVSFGASFVYSVEGPQDSQGKNLE
jgi:signal transduction histidine kinase